MNCRYTRSRMIQNSLQHFSHCLKNFFNASQISWNFCLISNECLMTMKTAAFPKLQCNIFQSNRWFLCCYLLTYIAPLPNFILFWRQNIIWMLNRSYSHCTTVVNRRNQQKMETSFLCMHTPIVYCLFFDNKLIKTFVLWTSYVIDLYPSQRKCSW